MAFGLFREISNYNLFDSRSPGAAQIPFNYDTEMHCSAASSIFCDS